jgi:hypothetical protein
MNCPNGRNRNSIGREPVRETAVKKIIIRVWDDVPLDKAVDAVNCSIQHGRVSNDGKQFCYALTTRPGLAVYATRTKTGTDAFQVCLDKRP